MCHRNASDLFITLITYRMKLRIRLCRAFIFCRHLHQYHPFQLFEIRRFFALNMMLLFRSDLKLYKKWQKQTFVTLFHIDIDTVIYGLNLASRNK